jgi:lactam utilization protein B
MIFLVHQLVTSQQGILKEVEQSVKSINNNGIHVREETVCIVTDSEAICFTSSRQATIKLCVWDVYCLPVSVTAKHIS